MKSGGNVMCVCLLCLQDHVTSFKNILRTACVQAIDNKNLLL